MNCVTTPSDLHHDNSALQEVGLFTAAECGWAEQSLITEQRNDPEHDEDQHSLQTWTTWNWFWMKWTWDADSGNSVGQQKRSREFSCWRRQVFRWCVLKVSCHNVIYCWPIGRYIRVFRTKNHLSVVLHLSQASPWSSSNNRSEKRL